MENSIYGVDIEKGAVDIARLRFWLAMIVEENEPMPLPNLHFKIMHGNSLIESYCGLDLSDLTRVNAQKTFWDSSNSERESLVSDLKRYYGESDHTERQRIFDSIIKNVRRQIHAKDENLSQKGLDPSDNSQFFLWHTWFTDVFEKGGFDIVIGNPPYGANIDSLTELYESLYPETSHGYKDIYKYFFDQGMRITKPKGILCYITPNTYLRQPRYGDVRRFLLKFSINQILDLGEDIFEDAVVPVAITLTTKATPRGVTSFVDLTSVINVDNAQEMLCKIEFTDIAQETWNNTINNIFVINGNSVSQNAHYLEEIMSFKDAGINYQRVKVGLSEKGKSDLSKRLLYEGERESNTHIEFWKGTDINEFFIERHTNRFCRPNIELADNERVILNANYFAIAPKLIWRQTAPYPICAIDYSGIWFGRSIQAGIIKPEYSKIISYEYLCGLLNSTTLRSMYETNVKETGRVFPQVKLEKLKPLPIIIPSDDIKGKVEQLVRCIIEHTARGLDVREQKEKLDKIVADIYKHD
jgi:hypothetical protein